MVRTYNPRSLALREGSGDRRSLGTQGLTSLVSVCSTFSERYTAAIVAVLARVLIAVVKHHDQRNLGRKGVIWLMFPCHCSASKKIKTGTQTGKEMKTGVDAESLEGAAY